jgi:hypothetical protein
MSSIVAPTFCPTPWWATNAAADAVREIGMPYLVAEARIKAVMVNGKAAMNATAAGRLMERLQQALRPHIPGQRIHGDRYECIMAEAFAPARPVASNDNSDEPPAMSLRRCLVVAGKRVDLRASFAGFDIGQHAIARLLQRGGLTDRAQLQATLMEGLRSADTTILALLQNGRHLLGAGSTPVLLRAGFGAFLGHLRLLPCSARTGDFVPVVEAHTWISRDMFSSEQADVEDLIFEAAYNPAVFDHLVAALALFRKSMSQDRRLASGLNVLTPDRLPSASNEKSLPMNPALAFLRLQRNIIDPDRFAREYRSMRLAA